MLIEDFSIETVQVHGYPVKSFSKRFTNAWQMFYRSAEMHADEIYLVEDHQKLTFKQAAGMAAGLAEYLNEKAGIAKGDHVGILMENSIHFILAFWAVQKLGAVAVIFNTRLAVPEMKRQLQFSDLKILLSSLVLSEKIAEIPATELSFRHIIFEGNLLTYPASQKRPSEADEISEDDTAFILFTSGTTGIPKGVMISHRNIITCAIRSGASIAYGIAQAAVQGRDLGLASEDTTGGKNLLIAAPLFHIMALEQMVAAVFLGLGSILVSSFNPGEIAEMINRGDIYGFTGTPTMYWLLLHKTLMGGTKVKYIRRLGFGAAPMAPDLLKELRRVFPSARLRNGYGMTEAPSISSLPDNYMETRPTSVGKPTFCTEIKIVDPTSRKELGNNVIGELKVRGATVTRGYYKAPEETAKVYREGWFYTGDMAYQDDDGFIYLVGRCREMINRGGENVYPVEVENVLHMHPKILDVAVFGLPDPVMGSIVACAIIPRPGRQDITLEEIQEFCRGQLASYKIPQRLFLLPELPTNPGGKVMKDQLIAGLKI